jgi:hypothetical protein
MVDDITRPLPIGVDTGTRLIVGLVVGSTRSDVTQSTHRVADTLLGRTIVPPTMRAMRTDTLSSRPITRTSALLTAITARNAHATRAGGPTLLGSCSKVNVETTETGSQNHTYFF